MHVSGYNHNPRILWIGHWHSDKALKERKAVNQAALTWTRGLLSGLKQAGCDLYVCTHCRERYWPAGEIYPGDDTDFDHSIPFSYVKYFNIPRLRPLNLRYAYRRKIADLLVQFKPDFVFTYNLYSYHCCFTDIIKQSGSKWIPVILDQDDPELDDWTEFRKQSSGADGLIFLSWWGYENCPLPLPRLHLDGGVDQWLGSFVRSPEEKYVVYSGKYDDNYGGLDRLFEIFKKVKTQDCGLFLTGKDPRKKIDHYLRREKRAKYLGFLDQDKLVDVQSKAMAFINPRPPEINDNRMMFPSKLLNYLSYGIPVISTWTEGLSPAYRDVVWFPSDEGNYIEEAAALVERSLSMSLEERNRLFTSIKNWVMKGHTWSCQCDRLVEWLKQI